MKINDVLPRWVIVANELRLTSDFAHLAPADRPKALCPECKTSVILKLGPHRIHHYAHKPDVECSASILETALHLNTKFHIYQQLENGKQLSVRQRCTNCSNTRPHVWLKGWDKVEIEYTVNSFRPDIALLNADGQVMGAIEIVVTNPVDEAKSGFYEAAQIVWLEIKAKASLYSGQEAWTVDKPLSFTRIFPPFDQSWICDSCRHRKLARRQYIERQESRRVITLELMMVDFYYRSLRHERIVYFIRQESIVGEPLRLRLVENGKPHSIACVDVVDANEAQIVSEFKQRIDQYLVQVKSDFQIIDVVIPWGKAKQFGRLSYKNFPRRFYYNMTAEKWVPDDGG